jgi:uncharacterized membrane protein YjdF
MSGGIQWPQVLVSPDGWPREVVMAATEAERYERRQRWVYILRTLILIAGVYQLVLGEFLIGLATLVCVGAIALPAFISRGRVKALPLEFEVILFFMVFLQFVIGETFNFYENVPYFDKVVHFTLPLFLGYIVSLLAYTMYVTGNLRATLWPTLVVIVLVTLGVGAIWEIIEYGADVFLGLEAQGSLVGSPLTDTMNDLIADTLGGIFGALLAVRYVRRGRRSQSERLRALTGEISADFGREPAVAKPAHPVPRG